MRYHKFDTPRQATLIETPVVFPLKYAGIVRDANHTTVTLAQINAHVEALETQCEKLRVDLLDAEFRAQVQPMIFG
jgi:hypothetical protein